MLRNVARLIRIAAGTSLNRLFISTTSAASIAISVPAPMAIPISALVSAGASLIPSPTIATFPFSFSLRITCEMLVARMKGTFSAPPQATRRAASLRGAELCLGTTTAVTYTVEVEDGVDTTSFGGDEAFARMVAETLANPKSWTHDGKFAFTRLDASSPEQPDFRVSLTSPSAANTVVA